MPCPEGIISIKDRGGKEHTKNTQHKILIAVYGSTHLEFQQSRAKGRHISVSVQPVWAT